MRLLGFLHKHSLNIIQLPKLFLKDGGHTQVILLKCWCGHKEIGFPSYNYELALKEGTPETIKILKQHFNTNMVKKN